MVYNDNVKAEISEYNRIDLSNCHIFIGNKKDATLILTNVNLSTNNIPFVKYTIKETDMRVKTATITTPVQLDLTQGTIVIKIVSNLHENFVGEVLDDSYKENSDGTYSYQCQDMSREYQSKFDYIVNGADNYRVIQSLLTTGILPLNQQITQEWKNSAKNIWSGLRPKGLYNGKLWGNPVGTNFMEQKQKMIIRNKSYIEAIRDICHGAGYVDVYFSDNGVLQIEPISIDDWKNTGLWLTTDEIASREFKFDITNAITGAVIQSTDATKAGNAYGSKTLTGLNLAAIFGRQYATVSNPNQSNTTIKSSSTSSSTSTKVVSDNSYGKKSKKVWINCDGGLTAKKNAIASALKSKGWSVKISGTGPGYHYNDYWNVTKDYQCYVTLYNGFCAGTMREAYSSKIQNVLKKKSVVLVPMWDSSGWTNPKGMKPYRYGDFTGYNAKRAWDDNFSSSNPSINNVGKWLKDNNAKYCCHPTTDGLVKQFLAGGYFASTGK